MSDLAQLRQLLRISTARYEKQRQALARLSRQEADLRTERIRLDAMARGAGTAARDQAGMQAVGADMLWLGWLGRARTDLNMQLARILAMKAHEQQKVRKAFGRVAALEELIATRIMADRKQAEAAELDGAMDYALRQRWPRLQ